MPKTFDVGSFIDNQPLGRVQSLVLVLCLTVMVCDGYEVYSMGFLLQPISEAFKVSPAAIAPLFVFQNIGLALGALASGPLADRFGRRRLMLGSVVIFSLLTLATALASSVTALIAFRFVSGLFFAGMVPNAVALTSEFAPRRYRATLVTWLFIGYTGGAALGGPVITFLVKDYGWQIAFIVGGVVPLAFAIPLFFFLPESIKFNVLKGRRRDDVLRILRRMDRDLVVRPDQTLILNEQKIIGSSIAALFQRDRRLTTCLLWIVYCTNLMVITIVGAFLPIFLHKFGNFTAERAAQLTSLYSVSAMVVSLFIGRVIDRLGAARVLAPLYLVGALAMISLGLIRLDSGWTLWVILLIGATVVTAQNGLNALTAMVYPTGVRSTGVGWAQSIGRVGGMIGPIFGGLALARNWDAAETFAGIAVPLLVACVAMLCIAAIIPRPKPSGHLEVTTEYI